MSSKARNKQKLEESWGRSYARENENRDTLSGRPDALRAYDKEREIMSQEKLWDIEDRLRDEIANTGDC